MLNKILFGSPLHEHAEPAQRVRGVAELPPDSPALAQLLAADPAPEVRGAAAARCTDLAALTAAWRSETAAEVRTAIAASLGSALAASEDGAAVQALLTAPDCGDAIRAQVALHAPDEARRRSALDGIGDENVLVDIALNAAHAPMRLAAAERVHAPEPLRRLYEAARDKDRGVARLARQRLDALSEREAKAGAADALIAQAQALAAQPGHILTAAIELDRRWKALALTDDPARSERWTAIGQQMQQRFAREQDEYRAQVQIERRVNEWMVTLQAPSAPSALPALREELAALREQAMRCEDAPALARLDEAEKRIAQWEQAAPKLAAAEALVLEAEELAAGTPIDDAQLPARWQALELAARTPALTRRFEAALLVIEQRRLAQVRAAQQQESVARHQLHTLLHTAEQALAAGQLQAARAALDETRAFKAVAGTLPKPTVQRLSRLVQQLVELERWEKFGQQNVRMQLIERAEALAGKTLAPAALAREVQALRAEWKQLDEQYAGVPKALWERFDGACEKAYAPAARHFAEQATQHKQARKQREEFIAAAEAHAPTLLTEPLDARAIERWLRATDSTWHGATLGSVEPGAWKKLDAKMRAALAPLRDALSAYRQQAKTERQALVAAAEALAAKALQREAPSQVKELQTRWQAQAKQMPLAQRDEQKLWEQFRSACNAVFDARKNVRKEVDQRKHEQRRAFEVLCEQLEQLASSGGSDETQLRRARHEMQEKWKKEVEQHGPPPGALDARYRAARAQVETALSARAHKQEAAVWHALLVKEQLCAELDALVIANNADLAAIESVRERWAAAATIAPAIDGKLVARRDAAAQALVTLNEEYVREDYLALLDKAAAVRRDALLELELMLHLDSPAELQPQRLAVQVKQLRKHLKRGASDAGSAGDVLLEWCAQPGVADARDRQRVERIAAALERRR